MDKIEFQVTSFPVQNNHCYSIDETWAQIKITKITTTIKVGKYVIEFNTNDFEKALMNIPVKNVGGFVKDSSVANLKMNFSIDNGKSNLPIIGKSRPSKVVNWKMNATIAFPYQNKNVFILHLGLDPSRQVEFNNRKIFLKKIREIHR